MEIKPVSKPISSSLMSDIISLFDVPEEFVLEYQKQQPSLDWHTKSWEEFYQKLCPTNKMYVPYAMSSIVRGRDFYSLLEKLGCVRAKNRYLDIGTAYAGYLRAFKENGFNEVVGIEVKEHLAKLGLANIHGLNNARLIVGDFLNDDYSSLGTFDLISCNDVIEHVADASLAIKKMSTMVAQGGVLILAVPNKDCISNVKSDGHFNLFGITQLHRNIAPNYYAAASELNSLHSGIDFRNLKVDEYNFEMGEMYHLDWYIDELNNHNLNVDIADINKIGNIKDAPILLSELKDVYFNWCATIAPTLDQKYANEIIVAVDNYINQLEDDLSLISNEDSTEYFENKYLNSCWYFLAYKEKPFFRKINFHNLIGRIKKNILHHKQAKTE